MNTNPASIVVTNGGESSKVTLSTTSAQSVAFLAGQRSAVVTVTVTSFIRRGPNPVAVVDADQYLLANIPYRIHGINDGDKLAILGTAAGLAYITPGA